MKKTLILLNLLGWLLLAGNARAELTIEITSGVEGALPIAIVPFGWPAGLPRNEDVAAIVQSDLTRSGRFKPLPAADMFSRPTEVSQINFRDWRALGVDNLVIGRVVPDSAAGFQVQFRLFDVYRGTQLAGYSIPVSANKLRAAAHHISDLVYESLTGERGAFSTRIAYVTVTGAGDQRRYALQVADADGYHPLSAVTSREPIMSPAWSPDGQQLAYVSFEKKRATVYIQNLASGQREAVSAYPGINGAPAFSPDGRRLALTLSKDGNPEIYILDLATRQLQRITRNPAIDTEAAWSPDGRTLVFTSGRGGSPQLYRIRLGENRAERLTFEGSYNASGDFTPDGNSLSLIHRDQQDNYRVAMLDLKRGLLRVLSDGRLDESPSVAPNGSMVLYATEADGRGVLAASSVDGRVSQRLRLQSGEVREPAWSPFARE